MLVLIQKPHKKKVHTSFRGHFTLEIIGLLAKTKASQIVFVLQIIAWKSIPIYDDSDKLNTNASGSSTAQLAF